MTFPSPTLIQVRQDTAANFTSTNFLLEAGEPAYETDTGKVKWGDGVTPWNSLEYATDQASPLIFGGTPTTVFGSGLPPDPPVPIDLGNTVNSSANGGRLALTTAERAAIAANTTALTTKQPLGGVIWADAIDRTGATNVAAALNTLLQNAPLYSNVALLPGVYKLNDGIVVDIIKAGLIAPFGGVKFDCTGLTGTEVAMLITGSSAIANNGSPTGVAIKGLWFVGPGDSTSTTGVRMWADTATATQLRAVEIADCRWEEFGIGHDWSDNSYNLKYDNCVVNRCGTGLYAADGTWNSGERLTYVGCTINGCAIGIDDQGPNARFSLIACSLDYNTITIKAYNGGKVHLVGCHVEYSIDSGTPTPPPFEVGPGSSIRMDGGWMPGNGTYSDATAPNCIINNTADPVTGAASIFDGVWMNNLRTTTDLFSVGGGNTLVRDRLASGGVTGSFICVSETANQLYDGSMTLNPIGDNWSVVVDSSTPTDPRTGTRGVILRSTTVYKSATSSMAIQKTAALNSAFAIAVAVPAREGSMPGFIAWLDRGGQSITGSISVSMRFAQVTFNDARVMTIVKHTQASQSTNTLDLVTEVGSGGAWTTKIHSGRTTRRTPAWATHILVYVDMTATTSGTVYLDDVVITQG